MSEIKWIVQEATDHGWVMSGSVCYSHPESAVNQAENMHCLYGRAYRAVGIFELERFED